MKTPLLVALGTMLLFCGCATTPKSPPVKERTQVFEQPLDKVWSAMVATISGDYSIQVIEKQSGVLESQFVSLQGPVLVRYAHRPSILLGLWNGERVKLSVFVKATEDGKTSVRVRAHFEAFEFNTTKSWFVCDSYGILEQEILDRIAKNF